MDDHGEESPFSSEALSFDSTLDSLLDGNFIIVDKAINIDVDPSAVDASIHLPAQESIEADIDQNDDGDDENNLKIGMMDVNKLLEIDKSVDQMNDNINTGNDDQCITNSVEKVDQLPTGHVDNTCSAESLTTEPTKVINTVSTLTRCSSPDFGKIKEKRKRNMKKHSCHSNEKSSANEDRKISNHGEPEAKRRKSNKTENNLKCPYKSNVENKKSTNENNHHAKESKTHSKESKNLSKETIKNHSKEMKKSTERHKHSKDHKNSSKELKTSKENRSSVREKKELNKESKRTDKPLESNEEIKVKTDVQKTVNNKTMKVTTILPSCNNVESHKPDKMCAVNTKVNTEADGTVKSVSVAETANIAETVSTVKSNRVAETANIAETASMTESAGTTDDDLNDTLVADTDTKLTTTESLSDFNVESDNIGEYDDDDDNGVVTDDDDDDDEEYVDDDEIHEWLEEGVTKPIKKKPNKHDLKDGEFFSRDKHVLEEKGVNPFEVLPTGWVMITHDSGMPVYLHKSSRVCTFSKPYFIGSGSSRRHDIPLSSIPCLQYRHELKKEENMNKSIVEEKVLEDSSETTDNDLLPKATLKSAEETEKLVSVGPDEFNTYCRGLFKFKTVKIKRFKTWREKRAHIVQEKKKEQLPKLASDTKLITCPIPPDNSTKKTKKKEFVMNPEGKTAVCILHEYTQNVLKVQPTYEFREVQNAESPFQATVVIAGIQYGSGCASGKRQAKNEAAKATLNIFLPELSPHLEGSKGKPKDELSSDLKYFEEVSIEDSRVPDLCNKASLPQPYQVLQTCLQRNFGLGDTTLKTDKKLISNQKTEFTMSVGKRTCTVVCRNKREAKQKAAQVMLQQLHPDLKNWASMLRLYSKNNEVGYLEREDDDAAVTNFHMEKKKNLEILDKLKSAMRKIKEQRKQYSDGNSIPAVVPAQPLSL